MYMFTHGIYIAISGFAENPFELKAADRIVTSVDMLTANNIYKVSNVDVSVCYLCSYWYSV